QRGSLANRTRITERTAPGRQRSLWIAKKPQRPREIGQSMYPGVLTKSRRQRAVLGRIVKRNRLFKVRASFRYVTRVQQRHAHYAMCNQQRSCSSLLLGQHQELRCKLTHDITFERNDIRGPEGVEDRKQQQRIFGSLSQRLRSLNEQARLLDGRLGFRRSIPFDVDEGGYKRDLKLDLLAAST